MRPLIGYLIIASLSLFGQAMAANSRFVEATVFLNYQGSTGTPVTYPGSARIVQHSGAYKSTLAASSASSLYGVLQAYAEASAGANALLPEAQATGGGSAYFTDDITISSPGRNGQNGTVIFMFFCHADLFKHEYIPASTTSGGSSVHFEASSQSNYATLVAQCGINDPFTVSRTDWRGNWVNESTPFANIIELKTTFTYGLPFNMKFLVRAYAHSQASGTKFARTYAMSKYASCAGIKSVTPSITLASAGARSVSESTTSITDYTVTSTSGNNYTSSQVAAPQPVVARTPGGISLGFETEAISKYQLKKSLDLKTWSNYGDVFTGIDGNMTIPYEIPANEKQGFFRIERAGFMN